MREWAFYCTSKICIEDYLVNTDKRFRVLRRFLNRLSSYKEKSKKVQIKIEQVRKQLRSIREARLCFGGVRKINIKYSDTFCLDCGYALLFTKISDGRRKYERKSTIKT